MAIDTGTFVAGIGILVTLDLSVLAISVANARKVGEDEVARADAEEAIEQAQAAHERITQHDRTMHGKWTDTAEESFRRSERRREEGQA